MLAQSEEWMKFSQSSEGKEVWIHLFSLLLFTIFMHFFNGNWPNSIQTFLNCTILPTFAKLGYISLESANYSGHSQYGGIIENIWEIFWEHAENNHFTTKIAWLLLYWWHFGLRHFITPKTTVQCLRENGHKKYRVSHY